MKALGKLYSNMPIKCSFDPLFDRQQPKIAKKMLFLLIVLLRGACPHWLS